jgi:RNA polymerase sigma-70 factor (ECF subfamily)
MRDQLEDIVQNAMTRVLGRSNDSTSLSAPYLYRVAYSAVVDEMRRQFRRKERAVGDREQLERLPQAVDPGSGEIPDIDLGRAVWDCLTRLIVPRRSAVAFHLQGYSAPETADRMGWTKKKAGHLIQRGLRDLRDCLAGKGIRP